MSSTMTRLLRGTSLAAFGITLGLGVAAANATDGNKGWYYGIHGGVNFSNDADFGLPTGNATAEYKTGWGAGLLSGYDFGPFKLQLDTLYRSNKIDTFNGNPAGGLNGRMTAITPTINAIYDIPTGTKWQPYIGAGVGYSYLKFKNDSSTAPHDWRFTYQGLAGVDYEVAPHWDVGVEYRYTATTDPTFDYNNQNIDGEYSNHSVLFQVKYKLNSPPPPPPPVAEAPPPPPPPPPAPELARSYMVFFDWNSTEITPEASTIIQEAAKASQTLAVTRVELTGHTDTSGPKDYNMALSLRRAEAVKNAMVQLGIPADQITTVGKGEEGLLVPTPDGVREPQNRRVEIVLP